jgi:hypothetical protein
MLSKRVQLTLDLFTVKNRHGHILDGSEEKKNALLYLYFCSVPEMTFSDHDLAYPPSYSFVLILNTRQE